MQVTDETSGAKPLSTRAPRIRNEFVRNVLTLMSGTAFAQVLNIVSVIIMGRLFEPEAVAIFALVLGAAQMVSPVAAGRYELAIVLPEKDDEARQLLKLATLINAVVALVLTVSMIFLAPTVADLLTSDGDKHLVPELAKWLYAAGPLAWLITQLTTMTYWLTRTKNFKQVAQNKIHQVTSVTGFQAGAGLLHLGVFGLVVAALVGYSMSLINLLRHTRGQYAVTGPVASMRTLAAEHKKMPLLNGPNALVDSVRLSGILMMISALFSVAASAQFSLAWRALQAPMSLINAAVSQVFFPQLARVARGRMLSVVRKAVLRGVLLGIVPFGLIWLLSPWLIPFVLGARWQVAGLVAQVLVPWLFMNFITSPISTVFVVVRRQFTMLLFAIVYCVVPLSIIWFRHDDLLDTMGLVAWSMAGLLVGFVLLALLVAWQFDRGFGQPSDRVEDAEDSADERVEAAEELVTDEGPLER